MFSRFVSVEQAANELIHLREVRLLSNFVQPTDVRQQKKNWAPSD